MPGKRVGRRRIPASRTKTRAAAKLEGFRSGYEKKVASSILAQGGTYEYEEGCLRYDVPATRRRYIPDFRLPNGIIIEAKGKFDAVQRKKIRDIIESNPDADIRMLLMRDNTLSKQSKTRYSEWCDKNGIKYHVSLTGEVPPEWLE